MGVSFRLACDDYTAIETRVRSWYNVVNEVDFGLLFFANDEIFLLIFNLMYIFFTGCLNFTPRKFSRSKSIPIGTYKFPDSFFIYFNLLYS